MVSVDKYIKSVHESYGQPWTGGRSERSIGIASAVTRIKLSKVFLIFEALVLKRNSSETLNQNFMIMIRSTVDS